MLYATYRDSEGDIHCLEAFRRGCRVYARVPKGNIRVSRELGERGVITFDDTKGVATERINDVFFEFGRY